MPLKLHELRSDIMPHSPFQPESFKKKSDIKQWMKVTYLEWQARLLVIEQCVKYFLIVPVQKYHTNFSDQYASY